MIFEHKKLVGILGVFNHGLFQQRHDEAMGFADVFVHPLCGKGAGHRRHVIAAVHEFHRCGGTTLGNRIVIPDFCGLFAFPGHDFECQQTDNRFDGAVDRQFTNSAATVLADIM